MFEYEAVAKQHLEPMVLDYYHSCTFDEITLRENRIAIASFDALPIIVEIDINLN
ncbi:MAG: hypothetical protein Kow0049_34410 [Stanieria sp.]